MDTEKDTNKTAETPLDDAQTAVAVAEPKLATKRRKKHNQKTRRQPQYHVLLWDDNDHTYDYVIDMMIELFRMDEVQAYRVARTVDHRGWAVCLTTTREHAELKRDQIHAYGKDRRINCCLGSMSATIEPAP
ncbi:MAG: ATP-dependent Clp protease adaptor ClpS [Pirellulaceae bacterium]|nr:ATP-dependent Clp protease adaptor ClpS [Planctomycetales bacterium]